MTTYQFLLRRFNLPPDGPTAPCEIPDVGRDILPSLFAELGFNEGAEIGVWRGQFSEAFCQANPNLHLYAVDPWKPYATYTDHTRHDSFASAYADAQARLAPYRTTLLRAYSVDAARQVPDRSLDFVYIDGNHSFESVLTDLFAWVPKVRRGGIVAGHDYREFDRALGIRVVEAVNAYTKAHDLPWFLLGRSRIRRGEKRDRERSYLWVNP